jgi:hypothetical protein
MTQVWVIRYDQGLYVFKDLDTAEATVKDSFKDCSIEREEKSDQSVSFAVMQGDRVQDRVFANAFDVYENPTLIHREVDKYDRPPRRRQEF